jgi:hypothetical protein
VAVAHVSNALGTINPVEQMIEDAHGLDIPVLLDGAQAMPHMAAADREAAGGGLDGDWHRRCLSPVALRSAGREAAGVRPLWGQTPDTQAPTALR